MAQTWMCMALLVLAVLDYTACQEDCPIDQEWKDCGSPCTLTCENYKDIVCMAVCTARCQCPGDRPILHNGRCVTEQQCEVPAPECPVGQIWNDCGSPCTKTCENYATLGCIERCDPRCECPRDKPILHHGQCIAEEQCNECTGDTVWNDCGSPCVATCDNYKDLVCAEVCEAKCECPQPDYILHNGRCISADQCPECDTAVKEECELKCQESQQVPVPGEECLGEQCRCQEPCKDYKCKANEECKKILPNCIRSPCLPQPSCVERKCPAGKPLNESGVEVYCGRGGERCPHGYYCEIEPADRWAVCCEEISHSGEDMKCPYGEPLKTVYGEDIRCGHDGESCPSGYECYADELLTSAVCCEDDARDDGTAAIHTITLTSVIFISLLAWLL